MQQLTRSLNLKSLANAFLFNLPVPALCGLASLLVIGVGMGSVAWSAGSDADPSSQAVAVQDEGRTDELEVGTRRILAALEAGTINSDQAYERLMGLRKRETARRNEDVRRRRAEYARAEEELMGAVKVGRISEEDAKRRLGEMRERMFPTASGGDEKRGRNSREEYARVEKELKAMVDAGKISGEDARRRLTGFRASLGSEDVRSRRAEYALVEKELMAAVKAGRISEEDAKRRLGEMRERMFPTASGGDEKRGRNSREEYARVAKELKAMVEAGKISNEDARRRLTGFRASLGSEDVRSRRAEYAQVEKALMAEVKAGRISEEDAKRRLGEMRARMFPTASGGDEKAVRIPREEYKRVQKELKAMVEAGKISEEDALRRLSGFRVRPVRGAGDKPAADGDRDAKLKRMYDGFERRIKAAVAKGDMTREEAAEKLKAFKERLSSRRGPGEDKVKDGDGRDRTRGDAEKSDSDRADSDVEKIYAAVKAGTLTREEAGKKLRALKSKKASGGGKDKVKDGDGRDRTRGDAEKPDSDRADSDVEKIYAAVKAGKLTREEAGKKLRALKSKKASGGGKDKKESRDRGDGATTPTRDF